MKCPKCKKEMSREAKAGSGNVWICRNVKCPQNGKKQAEGVEQNETV